jgi:exopolysaccharide biosynthesis WecB/TagA/CpsF family protein
VFLVVGAPQQEMIAKAALDRGDCRGVGLCIGVSLEFLAGKVQRAPNWMQQARLEWAFRLLAEPRRLWRRYLVEGPKIFALWFKWRQDQAAALRAAITARN